jgi:hypothetical protein
VLVKGVKERIITLSFEELYRIAPEGFPIDNPDLLGRQIADYYGLEVVLAFTVVADAPVDVPRYNFSVGDENHTIFQQLMERWREINGNIDDVIDGTFDEALKEIAEENDLLILIIEDGYDTGIVIARYPEQDN